MSDRVEVRLEPLGATVLVENGAPLENALFNYGVEFPCGGSAICGGCRVRVLDGEAAVSISDEDVLTDEEIDAGWRLACHLRAEGPLTLQVQQWDTPVLADFQAIGGGDRTGFGVAVDVGTTTLVAQLVDLQSGAVKAVRTQLNPQAAYGADVMSRVQLGMSDDRLTHLIRGAVTSMVEEVACSRTVEDVVLVGNTVMHHLYCGQDVSPLAAVPFRPDGCGEQRVAYGRVRSRFVQCIGGFVGSDILAGIIATGMHENRELTALVDLGTNGEIVVGNRDRLLCASTAAGPAFEAGRIRMGMRASTGAITHVVVENNRVICKVIGGGEPRGLCGSGLVDAVAAGLSTGRILPSGRMDEERFPLCGGVFLTRQDIRELQLAKGAVAAGLIMLLEAWGATPAGLTRLYLAGAFGNYVDALSATRIGLIPVDPSRIQPVGNTALRGARILLLNPDAARDVHVEHLELAAQPEFQDRFAAELPFPRN